MKKSNFKVGDKVFAKVKGYPPWPAHIVGESGKKYNVTFYGTGETGLIKKEDLSYYLKNKTKLQKPLKRKDYIDAFEQIEEAIKNDGGDGDSEENTNETAESDVSINASFASLNSSIKVNKKTGLKRKISADKSSMDSPKKSLTTSQETEDDSKEDSLSESVPETTSVIEPEQDVEKNEISSEKENNEKEAENVTKEQEPPSVEKIKETDLTDDTDSDFNLVSEKVLQNNILYAKYVQRFEETSKANPVERRNDHINDVLPVKLSSGKMAGIKLHLKWPLKFSNEFSRALYDESTALRVLEDKQKALNGDTKVLNDKDTFIPDIKMTEDEAKLAIFEREEQLKRDKIARMKIEMELSSLDGKIKNCLGLDEADPKQALEYLEQMQDMKFDAIMLKKHPHIVEIVRRLRNYVGNTHEWNMSDESLETFKNDAQKLRDKAEAVYCKFKEVVELPAASASFWEGFSELVAKFKAKCKELPPQQVNTLCAEPGSRQAFLDQLERESAEKENVSDEANADKEKNMNNASKEV